MDWFTGITAPMGGTNHLILQNQTQQPNQPSRHEHLYLDQFERVKTKDAKIEHVCIVNLVLPHKRPIFVCLLKLFDQTGCSKL